ncbi:MAG: hypothetical protein H6Q43_1918 [Deltaproteobacteria bacterium]|nr:hypothetical protein [Deltaproteobacteria bacterium]MBP1718480.1 hypothetical protein [Deltaproteobacteria bacterium]
MEKIRSSKDLIVYQKSYNFSLSKDLGFIEETDSNSLDQTQEEISRLLRGLINSLSKTGGER